MFIDDLFKDTKISASVTYCVGMQNTQNTYFAISTNVNGTIVKYEGTVEKKEDCIIDLEKDDKKISIANYYTTNPQVSDKNSFFAYIKISKEKLDKKIKGFNLNPAVLNNTVELLKAYIDSSTFAMLKNGAKENFEAREDFYKKTREIEKNCREKIEELKK